MELTVDLHDDHGVRALIEVADVVVGFTAGVDGGRGHRQCDEELMGARHPVSSWQDRRGAALQCWRH